MTELPTCKDCRFCFRRNGTNLCGYNPPRAFPVTEQEVEAMERLLEEQGFPEIPEHLQAKNLAKSITEGDSGNVVSFQSPPVEAPIETGLARAARNGEGSEIPKEIQEKMREDKAKHESSEE